MLLSPDPDSFAEELKCVHLQPYIWFKALKTTLPSQNIECYEWKVRGNYNGVPMQFSGNQLPPYIANSGETDLKKKGSIKQKQKIPKIMLPVGKNKKVDRNTEVESINTNDIGDES